MSGHEPACWLCGRGGMNDPVDAELARLRAIEAAAKAWLAQLDANKDPQVLYEADVALALRDMLDRRGAKP